MNRGMQAVAEHGRAGKNCSISAPGKKARKPRGGPRLKADVAPHTAPGPRQASERRLTGTGASDRVVQSERRPQIVMSRLDSMPLERIGELKRVFLLGLFTHVEAAHQGIRAHVVEAVDRKHHHKRLPLVHRGRDIPLQLVQISCVLPKSDTVDVCSH